MSVLHDLGKQEIFLNHDESILISSSEEEGYETREVTFKSNNELYPVGVYCPYDGIGNYGSLLYNNKFIMIVTRNRRDAITIVDSVFDMTLKSANISLKDKINEKYDNEFRENYKKLIVKTRS